MIKIHTEIALKWVQEFMQDKNVKGKKIDEIWSRVLEICRTEHLAGSFLLFNIIQ